MISKEVPFIDIHTHKDSSGCLDSSYGMTYGIHPWSTSLRETRRVHRPKGGNSAELSGATWQPEGSSTEGRKSNLTGLITLLKENIIAAIGETGLDRLHKDTYDLQMEVFEQHILLSEQYQKPLIIHNVKATADILRLHKKHCPKQAWIIHGFNGSVEEARQLTDQKCYLSVGESIFYPNRKITKSISSIPLEYLFLETDTSEKTIQQIYEKAAELLNIPLDRLKEQIFANFARLKLTPWKTGNNAPDCLSETMALINWDEAMC